MDQPLISVIIPIYNVELYLARCLDSVLNNTYRNLEILCIDDGSKDSSAAILRSYAEKDSRVVPIIKENGGVSSARNVGLDRMRGDYVCFVDSDDYVHPRYFELLYTAVRESGTEIAVCSYNCVEPDQLVQMEQIQFDLLESQRYSVSQAFRQHNLRVYCWGKLIRSDLTANLRFHEDLGYAEDAVFFAEVCENVHTAITFIPYRLYEYCQREDSLSNLIAIPQHLQVARRLSRNLHQSNGRDDIYLDQTIKRCLHTRYLASHILSNREAVRECNAILKDLRKSLKRTSVYDKKEKLRLSILIQFPFLYWLYRSIKQPDMWKWEKVERKKRREERRHHADENRG
jgi:glycosyltransferase involved in cell wall biosynthesis